MLVEQHCQYAYSLQQFLFLLQNHNPREKFVAAAYSDEVLSKGESSKLIELSEDKFMVLRINEKIPFLSSLPRRIKYLIAL
jgi:hypothetical protein